MQDDDYDTQFLNSRFFCSNAISIFLAIVLVYTYVHILPTVIWHLLQLYEISFYTTAAAIPILLGIVIFIVVSTLKV